MNIKFIKNKSKRNIRRENSINRNNRKNISIIILCLIFFVGLIIGIIYFKNTVNNDYFNQNQNFFENIDIKNMEYKKLFVESLFKNIILLVFMWIIGLSILGIPILVFFLAYEGFSLGISISYILTLFGIYKGYEFIFFNIYITSLINIFVILLSCNSALRVTLNIIKQKTSIKTEFIRHSFISIIMLILLIFSSIIEVNLIKFGI